jgi:hypothetical protein
MGCRFEGTRRQEFHIDEAASTECVIFLHDASFFVARLSAESQNTPNVVIDRPANETGADEQRKSADRAFSSTCLGIVVH